MFVRRTGLYICSICLLGVRVADSETPGGGGYSTNFYAGRLRPEVKPLTFFTKKVPQARIQDFEMGGEFL